MGDAESLSGGGSGSAGALVLHAVDVHKSFGRLQVLKGISLDVHRAETVCIIGPSGSGKSTFLRCINHLEQDRKSTRLNSSHPQLSRMPSSA